MGVACCHFRLLRGFFLLCALLVASTDIGGKGKGDDGGVVTTRDDGALGTTTPVWVFPMMNGVCGEKLIGDIFRFFSSGKGKGKSKRRTTTSVPKRIILGSTRFQGRFLGWVPFLGSKGRHGPAKGRARSLFTAFKKAGEAWQQQQQQQRLKDDEQFVFEDEEEDDEENGEEEEKKRVDVVGRRLTGQPYVYSLRTWNTIRSLHLKSTPTEQQPGEGRRRRRRSSSNSGSEPGFNITTFLQCLMAGVESAVQIYEATSTSTSQSFLRTQHLHTFSSSHLSADKLQSGIENITVEEEKTYGTAFVITNRVVARATELQRCITGDNAARQAFFKPDGAGETPDFPPFQNEQNKAKGGSSAAEANEMRFRIASENDFWSLIDHLRELRGPTKKGMSCRLSRGISHIRELLSALQKEGEIMIDVIVYNNTGRASVRLGGKLEGNAPAAAVLLNRRRRNEHLFWDSLFFAPSKDASGVKTELAEVLFVPEVSNLEEELFPLPVTESWTRGGELRTSRKKPSWP